MSGIVTMPMLAFQCTAIKTCMVSYVSLLIILTCFAMQIITVTKLERQEREPWPVGRSAHAACCLGFGSQHPHLHASHCNGGVDNDKKTLRDAWLFDVTNRRWKEVSGGVINVCSHPYQLSLWAVNIICS